MLTLYERLSCLALPWPYYTAAFFDLLNRSVYDDVCHYTGFVQMQAERVLHTVVRACMDCFLRDS